MRRFIFAAIAFCRKVSIVRSRFVFTSCILILFSFAEARAERVGFNFAGALQVPGTGNVALFGVSVPKTSPVTGSFAYDVTSLGVATDPQTKTYHQLISGGYNLNINNGAIRLSASDYVITVKNDVLQSPDLVDQFRVDYDTRFSPAPAPLVVNGNPWTGSTPDFIGFELIWPSTTFPDPDEPKLTADRPTERDSTIAAFVGSSNSTKLFMVSSITSIIPSTGDYNCDGVVDANDYVEWQKAFGQSDPAYSYADGNHNGVVDAADYTVWRDEIGPTGTAPSAVPEPASLLLLTTAGGWMVFAIRRRRC